MRSRVSVKRLAFGIPAGWLAGQPGQRFNDVRKRFSAPGRVMTIEEVSLSPRATTMTYRLRFPMCTRKLLIAKPDKLHARSAAESLKYPA